jgi:coproporphyrinogen III oxidase-like Fe-S oxidoreductase
MCVAASILYVGLGMNSASVVIQDTSREVQEAINRKQSQELN